VCDSQFLSLIDKVKFTRLFNVKWLTAATFFTIGVVGLTHLPDESVPDQLRLGGLDKLEHIVAYGMITFLFVFSLRTPLTLIVCLVLSPAIMAIGIIDELTQPLCNRTASFTDCLANIVGILIVLVSSALFKPRPKSTQAPTPKPEC
jgi:VanZ family protein